MSAEKSALQAEKPFVISRRFDAPRDLLWKSWTEAERLKQWWGPKGFVVHTCKVDLRPGGLFHYGMSAPDGSDMWGGFLYREIDPPRRLEFIVSFSDPHGGIRRHPGHLEGPLPKLSTATFQELEDRTRHALRRCGSGAKGIGHVGDVRTRRAGVLCPERRTALHFHAGHIVLRELRDTAGGR